MKNTLKKTFFLSILMLLLFSCETVLAQQFIIKANPLNLLVGRCTLGGEVAITEHSSLSLLVSRLNLGYNDFKYQTKNGTMVKGDLQLTNWAFMPEYRYYISPQVLTGFYVGAYGNYARMNAAISVNGGTENTTGNAKVNFNNFGLGLMTGYNFLIKEHFSIDVFGGLGGFWYNVNEITIHYQNEDVVNQKIPLPIAGIFPRFGLNFGYAF